MGERRTQAQAMGGQPPQDWQGIAVTLGGLGQVEFARLVGGLTSEAVFARPLQLHVTEPQVSASGAQRAGQIVVAFLPQHAEQARRAVQRLKTLMLRHGVQVDNVRVIEDEGGP